jgi:hypothetical protein
MARSVPIWKIYVFPKVSLYLESFVLKHATSQSRALRWETSWHPPDDLPTVGLDAFSSGINSQENNDQAEPYVSGKL